MRVSRALSYLLPAAVLGGVVVAGVKYLDSDAFMEAVRRFRWEYAPLILALTVAYLLTMGWRFVLQLRRLTGAGRWLLLRGYLAGQPCTLLPGGVAARAGLLSQVGVPVPDSAAAIAASSLADQMLLVLGSLVSALWVDAARKPALLLLSALLVASVLLGLEATRTWLLGVVERLMGRVRLLRHWRRFLDSARQLTATPVLLGILGSTAIAFALLVEALELSLRGVGAAVSYPTILLAFTLPTLMGRISAMPGGVGVTEAGMVAVLEAAAGASLEQAAAAVVIFRTGTVFFAALLGGLVYLFGWRGTPEVVTAER